MQLSVQDGPVTLKCGEVSCIESLPTGCVHKRPGAHTTKEEAAEQPTAPNGVHSGLCRGRPAQRQLARDMYVQTA